MTGQTIITLNICYKFLVSVIIYMYGQYIMLCALCGALWEEREHLINLRPIVSLLQPTRDHPTPTTYFTNIRVLANTG